MLFDTLPIWAQTAIVSGPIFGADPEGAPAGEPAGASTDNPPADKPDADKPIVVDPDEHVRLVRESQQKDAELAALQQEKTEREEAEEAAKAATRSKEENLSKQVETLTEDNSKLTLVNTENLLELAILKNDKFSWINTNNVVKLIDRTNIKIDPKTGKVEGVEKALADLAKENSHLLNAAEGQGNGSGNGQPANLPGQPSGGKPGSSQDTNAKQAKRAALVGRFGNVLTP